MQGETLKLSYLTYFLRLKLLSYLSRYHHGTLVGK